MPFALDVVYCQADSDGLPAGGPISAMTTLNGAGGPMFGRLSGLLELDDATLLPVLGGNAAGVNDVLDALLGMPATQPRLHDVTPYTGIAGHRAGAQPNLVVIYPASGPAQSDLRAAAMPNGTQWHYYIDQAGAITQLIEERNAARVQRNGGTNDDKAGRDLDRRSLAVAVEGGPERLSRTQAAALAWLLKRVMERFNIKREQVFTADKVPA